MNENDGKITMRIPGKRPATSSKVQVACKPFQTRSPAGWRNPRFRMDIKHRIKHKGTKTSLVDLVFSVKLQAQRQLETFVGPTWMAQSVEKNMKMSVRRTSWDHRSRYIRSLGTGLEPWSILTIWLMVIPSIIRILIMVIICYYKSLWTIGWLALINHEYWP